MKEKLFKITQIGFSCYFMDIEFYARHNDFEIIEYGPDLIGESFVVLKNEMNVVISYIMDGCNENGIPTFKCIYSDIKQEANENH
jgi:hypothetical protein